MNFMKFAIAIISTFSIFLVACQASSETFEPRADMTFVEANDVEFNAAMIHARETFSEFLEAKGSNDSNYSDFNVKIGLPSSEGTFEHIWVSDVSSDENQFKGKLINEPFRLPNYSIGDTVIFVESQISDWQYLKNGKSEGNFTTRIALKTMPADKAAEVREMLGWDK